MATFWKGVKPYRRPKFGARKAPCDRGGTHHVHDSELERLRCNTLHIYLGRGEIANLVIFPRYRLDVGDVHVCDYEADFEYTRNGERVTEDCKGFRTREYILKSKLMLAIHGIEIKETN